MLGSHNKILIPLILLSLMVYFISYWFLKAYLIIPVISVIYFIAADLLIPRGISNPVVTLDDNVIIAKGNSLNALSGGVFHPFTVITEKAFNSRYFQALRDHEAGHRMLKHALIENSLITVYSLQLAYAIKNNQSPWAYPVSVIAVLTINYCFHVLFEVTADRSVRNKKLLRDFLTKHGSSSICNRIRLRFL